MPFKLAQLSTDPLVNARRKRARERIRNRRQKDPIYANKEREKSRLRSRQIEWAKYGVSTQLAERMLKEQNFSCAICRRPFEDFPGRKRGLKPHLDHNHATDKVRDFLCQNCNSMLGHSRELWEVFAAASSYLRLHGPTEKVWGKTECLIASPSFELHRLTIKPMHRCSMHVHEHKSNLFYVLTGRLFIDTIDGDIGSLVVSTKLEPGDHTTIAPSLHHQFRTEALTCIALEMYYTEPLSEDIVRRNVGGPA